MTQQVLIKRLKEEYKERENYKERKGSVFQLSKPEVDLIMTIRNIVFGEIEGLKIIDRSPLGYIGAKKTVKI